MNKFEKSNTINVFRGGLLTLCLLAVLPFFLTSCDNFLNGEDVKNEITDAIAYNNAKEITVLVQPEEGTGSTVPSGNHKAKQGYDFEVSFSENPAYSFVKWIAVSKDKPQEIIADGISFEDASALKTKVKVSSDSTSIRLIPLCEQRIAVSGEPSPRYDPLGVSRDRSISVSFTKALAESSFIFAENEIPEGASVKKDESGKIWAYTLNSETFLKNISITNMDDYSIAGNFSKPEVNGKLLTINVDKTNPIEFNAGEIFKTIKVTISADITDSAGIKMNAAKSWNYQITESTDEKATVILTSAAAEGSVYLAGTKAYSLGQKITLAFTENADYQFVRWDYDSSIIYIEDPKSLNTVALVREKTTEESPTQIKAVCAPRLRVTSFSPVNDSTKPSASKNSSVVITFNHNLPTDEAGLAQLQNLMITVGGSPVKSSFNAPVINAATVTFSADESNMLEVAAGQTKTVTVSIPADFYYLFDDGTKVTYGGNGKSLNYKINETTLQQAEITFTASANSGSLTGVSGTNTYSLGQELELEFVPANNYQFNGWTITRGAEEVSESEIKILDKSALKTKLIVYKELKGVTVTAKASEKLTLTGTPSSGINPKDSKIELIFNKAIPAECDSLLGSIKVRMNGSTVENYFTPSHTTANPEKITLTNTKYLDVGSNETKLISVIVPVDFYYIDGNVKVYLEKEYSFDYEVSSSTNSKTDITFKLADGDSGEIIPASDSYDIGKVIDLKFNPQRGYRFTGWNISAGGLAVSEEKVKIEDKTAASTKLYIYDKVSNVQVTANAYLVPAITGISPEYASTGCDQDSTIKITFNKAMDVSSFNFTDVNSVSIKTASGDELFPAGGYYETPEFSDNNKVLNIPTVKGKFILPVNSPATKDLTICLNKIKDAEGYLLNDSGSYAYTYRVNEKKDNEKPVIKDIHLYSTSDTTDYFYKELTNQSFEQWSSVKVNRENGMALYQNGDFSRNHVSHLYITLKAYDKDSGLKEVRIKETYKRDTSNNTVTEQSHTKFYSAGDFETAKDSEGNTVHDCKIEYDFAAENPNDGLYLIQVSVLDKAGIESVVTEYWVIKDTYNSLIQENVSIRTSDPYQDITPYIPGYNSEFFKYETGFPFIDFNISDTKYYNSYYSQRTFSLKFYEEDSEKQLLIDSLDIGVKKDLLSIVRENLNEKKRNPEKNGYFEITITKESGITGNYVCVIPKSTTISYISEERVVVDDFSSGTVFLAYTYQQDLNSDPSELNYCGQLYFTKENLLSYLNKGDGIYNLYIIHTIDNKYSAFGKSYRYYKGIDNPINSAPIPNFSLPGSNEITYTKNASTAEFDVAVVFPENEYKYFLMLKYTENLKDYYYSFSSVKNIIVPNGYEYAVFIAVKDANGNFVAKSGEKKLSLKSFDNYPPNLGTGDFSAEQYIDSAKIRIKSIPQDRDESGSYSYINELELYFVPKTYGKNLSYDLLNNGLFKKQVITITENDKNKGYFDISLDGIEYGIYRIFIYAKDIKGNERTGGYKDCFEYRIEDIPITSVLSKNGENYKMKVSTPIINNAGWYTQHVINIQTCNGNQWGDFVVNKPLTENSDKSESYEFDCKNTESRFMKITTRFNYSNNIQEICGNYFFKPLYIYPDYYKYLYDYEAAHPGETAPAYCKSKTWLQTANGWQIFADKPCFVHTRWCSKNLTTAGDLSRDAAYEWEARAQETGIVFNDGTSTTFSYTNDNLSEVPGGAYYTTICHFADGTVLMSEVKKK